LPGDIVVIDDLASHKSPEIRKAAEVARQIRTAAEGEFLPGGGHDRRGSGETMTKRGRRNPSPGFKAKAASAAVKNEKTVAKLAAIRRSRQPDYAPSPSSGQRRHFPWGCRRFRVRGQGGFPCNGGCEAIRAKIGALTQNTNLVE
jgi:hypothetical protein